MQVGLRHRGEEQPLPAIVRHDREGQVSVEFAEMDLEQERWLVACTFARADLWLGQWGQHDRDSFLKSVGQVLAASMRGFRRLGQHTASSCAAASGRSATKRDLSMVAPRVVPSLLHKMIPMRLVSATAACLLTVVAGLAWAQPAPTPAPAQAATDMPPEAAVDPAAASVPPASATTRTQTLRELGIDYEITLRGIHGNAGVPFGVRTDELVNQAQLHLRYSYSPSLLPDLSHLKVTVNGVTVATLPTPTADAGESLSADITIDPRVVADYNQINLELIGHYTRDCEDPDHSSLLKANIDAANSTLTLTTTPVALADNLALLPVPFFDAHDVRPLVLPFHFAQRPDNATLQAAGIVSSWFGALAGYRGASFPVTTGSLPATGNAVLFATPDSLPGLLSGATGPLPDIHGPTLAVMTHPTDANAKLLLVLGRNAAELAKAATALALHAPLSGAVAAVGDVALPEPRKPYDAPKWVDSERPVYFRELVDNPEKLNVTGYHPDLIRVGLQLPPDLFVWRSQGIPLALKYRYTVPDQNDQSALNISINDAFVTTLPLNGHGLRAVAAAALVARVGRARGDADRATVEPADRPVLRQQPAALPLLLRPPAGRGVQEHVPGRVRRDRSGFEHRPAQFPALHGDAEPGRVRQRRLSVHPPGRPGRVGDRAARQPDRSGLRQCPDPARQARFGHRLPRAACEPGHRRRSQAGTCRARSDRARLANHPTAAARLGGAIASERQRQLAAASALATRLLDKLPGFLSFDAGRTDLPTTAEVSVQPQADDVLIMGLQSPLSRGRSVVVLQADDPSNLARLFEAWADPVRLAKFQGSVVLLQQDKVTSLAGNQSYYIGHLPLPTWLRWYFSNHPVWLAIGVVVLCLLLALAARVLLRMHSAIRLREGRGK